VLLLGALALVAGFLLLVAWSLRRDIRRFRTAPIEIVGPPPLVPRSHREAITDLEALGFTVAVEGTFRMEGQAEKPVILLVDHTRTVLVEVTNLTASPEQAEVSLASSLAAGRGWLSTQTTPGILAGPHELRQVFPGASVARLVREHGDALAAIRAQGFRVDEIPSGAEHDRYVALVRFGGEDHPPLLSSVFGVLRLQVGACADCGRLVDDPHLGSRVAALRA
jgi:hypothetical protein